MAGDHVTLRDGASAASGCIDQQLIASMVNCWVAESGEFMQAFSRQAEAKLLALGQKVDRLERLVYLFEHKLRDFQPAAPSQSPEQPKQTAHDETARQCPPAQPASAEGVPSEALAADVAQASGADVAPAGEAEDDRYAVYMRMQRMGVPDGAIRQKFETDAASEPSLDRSKFCRILGIVEAPPAPRPPPPPAPQSAQPPPATEDVPPPSSAGGEAGSGPAAPASDEPAATEQRSPRPAPVVGGMMNIAEMAAAAAAKRRARVAASESGQPGDGGQTRAPAVTSGPAGVSAGTSSPGAAAEPLGPAQSSPASPPRRGPLQAPAGLFGQPPPAPSTPAKVASTESPQPQGPLQAPTGLFGQPLPATSAPAKVASAETPPSQNSAAAALMQRRLVVAEDNDGDSGMSDVSDF